MREPSPLKPVVVVTPWSSGTRYSATSRAVRGSHTRADWPPQAVANWRPARSQAMSHLKFELGMKSLRFVHVPDATSRNWTREGAPAVVEQVGHGAPVRGDRAHWTGAGSGRGGSAIGRTSWRSPTASNARVSPSLLVA